jgi:acetyl esterase/lipase
VPFDDGEDRSVLGLPSVAPRGAWRYGPAEEHIADAYLPTTAKGPTIALVHGGFWRPEYDRLHVRPLASALAAAGHRVVSLEYSRVPGDPDRSLADLRLAIERLGVDPPDGVPNGLPLVIGHSAGGHLVLLLAADQTSRIRAGLALAPVADLGLADELRLDGDAVRAFLGGEPGSRPDMDPAKAPAPGATVTILHGDRDSLVPLSVSQSYCSAVPHGATLVVLPGIGHFELIDPRSGAFAQVLAAIDRTGIE